MRWPRAVGILLLAMVWTGCQGSGFLAVGKPKPYEGSLIELFRDIRERHRAVRSCQLEFEVKVTEEGKTRVRKGTAWVQGMSVRLDEEIVYEALGGVSDEVRVSNGAESWTYQVDQGVVTHQPLAQQTQEDLAERVVQFGPLALVLEMPVPGPNMEVTEVRTTQGKQICVQVSQGAPNSTVPWLRRSTWVNAKDLLVSRVEFEGARQEGGRLVSIKRDHRYWGYEVDPEFEADLFVFVPPMGTRIQRLPPR